ncbi:hypothetical protein SMICM304S_05380 [Streptomyces microflavus]
MTLASLSLSPWPMKTCFMVGTRRMWMFLPTLAGYRQTRTVERSRFIRCVPAGTQSTGTEVSDSCGTRPRSRMMISGRPSTRAMVSSHMLPW